MSKDITLTVDYHDRVCVIRWFDHGTGQRPSIHRGAHDQGGSQANGQPGPPGGGPRGTRDLDPGKHHGLGPRPRTATATASSSAWPMSCRCPCRPRPGGARPTRSIRRGSSASTSTAACRWLTNPPPSGVSSAAWSPTARVSVNRRTALRNWINRYLAHETWFDRTGLWSLNRSESDCGPC